MVKKQTKQKKLDGNPSSWNGLSFSDYLVVIGLLAVLGAVLLGVLGPAKLDEKAELRDLQRIEALNNLNRAIILGLVEQELVLVNTSGCDECNSVAGSRSAEGGGWIKFEIPEGRRGLSKYLDVLPTDPLNSGEFYYSFVSDARTQSFKISVPLESEEKEIRMRLDGGTSPRLYEVGNNLSL